jgi:uncharacterized protein
MKTKFKYISLFLIFISSSAFAQDFQKGLDASDEGDFATSIRQWRPLAEQGNASAQYSLGFVYDYGLGVSEDYTEAFKWYRLAAEQGDASAQFNLGVRYENGLGVPEDNIEAVKWYRLAAEQGFANAQFNLGVKYAKGEGVPEDIVIAYMWWNLSAAQGEVIATNTRKRAEKLMTREQIAEAQKMSREWMEKHQ